MSKFEVVFDWKTDPSVTELDCQQKRTMEHAFVKIYNEFCDTTNPCLPIWNYAFDRCFPNLTADEHKVKYHDFMKARYNEVLGLLKMNNSIVSSLILDDYSYLELDDELQLHYGIKFLGKKVVDVSMHLGEKVDDDYGT